MTLLAKLAQIEWDQRLTYANRMVAERRWSPIEADGRLTPWLAIALKAGAEPPEATPFLEEIRQEPGARHCARSIAAYRLCPSPDLRAELTRARDAAIAAMHRLPGSKPHSDRAAGLQFIALYLGCPPAQPVNDDLQEAA